MIRKLVNLIKNYDKIMSVIENSEKTDTVTPVAKVTSKKSYSLANTPREQKEFIEKKLKGEN